MIGAFGRPEKGPVFYGGNQLNQEIDRDKLRANLLDILSKLVGLEAESISDNDRLREDLGLDSLQSMELLSRISDQYDLDLEIEDAMDVETVGDILGKLVELVRSRHQT